jgi:hypothetical protein
MEVTWSDGKSTKGDFEQDKTTFMWDMGTFIPTQPISDVKSIVGTYEGGVSLSNGGNRIAVSKRLELHADGTYRWEGIAFVQGDTPDTTLYGGSAGGSTGTWRVSGNIATLTQSDGKVLRQVVFPYDEEGGAVHPSHLFLGGMLFKKQ